MSRTLTHEQYEQYRQAPTERSRIEDLLRLLPQGQTLLDIGAREGYFSRIFAESFAEVTALDLTRPTFQIDRVKTVAGDVTRLDFPDNAFDVVFCAEVLEHVPELARACLEIERVSRRYCLIGVPFQQDTRLGKTTCARCGRTNPPYGHVNTFTESKLRGLFPGCEAAQVSFVGNTSDATNWLAALLLDWAGNPWGTYSQEEPCIHCGAELIAPASRSIWQRGCGAAGATLEKLQTSWSAPHGNWIHILFEKRLPR
jgi:SAM-dependent methyltransferase